MAQPNNTYINLDGKHQSPARSQERGNVQETYKSYGSDQDYRGARNSSLPGIPYIGGGVRPSALQPKAWVGADGVYLLNNIETDKIKSKMSSDQLTVRGSAIINNKAQDIFPGDEARDPANINNYLNYIFNRGGGSTPLGSGIYNFPQVGNSLNINSTGKDAIEDGSESKYSVSGRWAIVLAVSPADLLGGFFVSKGHTDSSNCEVAIWSDGNNVYRTIGGTDKIVDSVANIISTSEHIVFQLFNLGDASTPADSFSVNDQVIWDEETDSRGAVTSPLPLMIGGIHSTSTPGSVSDTNALGHYRMFLSYNSDRLAIKEHISELTVAQYVNYTCSPFSFGDGDSVMNAYAIDIAERVDGFWFRTEKLLQDLGYDILFANGGTSGAGTSQKVPDDMAYPANQNEDVTYNPLPNNLRKFLREYRIDFFGMSCAINEYAGVTDSKIPFNWLDTAQQFQMMHKSCSEHGAVFMHNTCFTLSPDLPLDPYGPNLRRDVTEGINAHATNVFDWSTLISDPSTGAAYSNELQQDSAHPSLRAHHAIALRQLLPQFAGYLYTIKAIYPTA